MSFWNISELSSSRMAVPYSSFWAVLIFAKKHQSCSIFQAPQDIRPLHRIFPGVFSFETPNFSSLESKKANIRRTVNTFCAPRQLENADLSYNLLGDLGNWQAATRPMPPPETLKSPQYFPQRLKTEESWNVKADLPTSIPSTILAFWQTLEFYCQYVT